MKKILCLLLAFSIAAAMAVPGYAREFAQPQLELPCKAAILIDQTSGTVLYQKEAEARLPIASITKVMTLLLTMEALENGKITMDDIVPVSTHSYEMGGSQIWLEPGERFTLHELLKAVCVASANDAAVAVAEYVGGSEPVFVDMMNQEAVRLGMSQTHFVNACGLDAEGHLSCARDVAIMSREILTRFPEITEFTTIWMDTLRNGATQLVNTNKLLRNYDGITGLKTGTTGGAGVCVTASATRDGLSLIAVVLGSPSGQDRWQAARALLDYGFANYASRELAAPETAPGMLPVIGGENDTLTLEYPSVSVLLQKGEESALEIELELPETLVAPISAGQEIGRMTAKAAGETLESQPIRAAQTVERLSFTVALKRLWQHFVSD